MMTEEREARDTSKMERLAARQQEIAVCGAEVEAVLEKYDCMFDVRRTTVWRNGSEQHAMGFVVIGR